jgi:hypothetical protein
MTDDELLAVIAETITDALTDFDAELRAANTLCLHAIVAALEVHQPGVMRTTADLLDHRLADALDTPRVARHLGALIKLLRRDLRE